MNEKMTVNDLADVLVRKHGLEPAVALDFVNAVFEICQEGLMHDKVMKIKDFGTFKIVDFDARVSVNVNTGERTLVDSRSKLTFTPDAIMKELVNKPFSQFETVVLNDGVDFSDLDQKGEDGVDEDETTLSENLPGEDSMGKLEPAHEKQVDPEEKTGPEGVEVATSEGNPSPSESSVEGIPTDEVHDEGVSRITEALEAARAEMLDASNESDDSIEPHASDEPDEPDEPEMAVKSAESGGESISDLPESDKTEVEEEPVAAFVDDDAEGEVSGGHMDTDVDENPVEHEDVAEQTTESVAPLESVHASRSLWVHVVSGGIVLLLMAATAYVGYLYGRHQAEEEFFRKISKQVTKTVRTARPAKEHAEDTTIVSATQIGTIQADKIAKEDTAKTVNVAKPVPVSSKAAVPFVEKPVTPVEKDKASAGQQQPDYAKYEKMDARVRTGAYRIVGQAKVITARKGQTLRQLSRINLGDGMECYMEVYNGMSADAPLEEGTKVKVPQLVLKKKKGASPR